MKLSDNKDLEKNQNKIENQNVEDKIDTVTDKPKKTSATASKNTKSTGNKTNNPTAKKSETIVDTDRNDATKNIHNSSDTEKGIETEIDNTQLKPEINDRKSVLKKVVVCVSCCVVAVVATVGILVGTLVSRNKTASYVIDGQHTTFKVKKNLTVSDISKPSKTGYVFVGWFKDPSCQIPYNENDTISKNAVLYSKFTPKLCRVLYYSNAESSEIEEREVYFNENYQTIENTFSRPNYNFVGWSLDENASADINTDSNSIVGVNKTKQLESEVLEYFAIWQGVSKNVVYNFSELLVDGKNYNIDNTAVEYGKTITLPTLQNVTHKIDSNKKFTGFNINGVYYNAGDVVKVDGDIIITPTWIEDSPSVLYLNTGIVLNGASDATHISSDTKLTKDTQSQSYTYSLPQVEVSSRNNYKFLGWNTKADGTGTMYQSADDFTTKESINYLYGIWEGKEVSITLVDGDNSETINAKYGDTITLPTLSKDKYNFAGWQNTNGDTYKYKMYVTSSQTLNSHFKWNEVVLSVNSNGAVGSINNINLEYGTEYEFTSAQIDSLKRQYYTLVGFSTDKYATNGSFKITVYDEHTTVYAVWKRNTVKVKYVDIDGKLILEENQNQGESIILGGDKLSKTGYVVTDLIVGKHHYENGESYALLDENVTDIEIKVVYEQYKVWFNGSGNVDKVNFNGQLLSPLDLNVGDKIIVPQGLNLTTKDTKGNTKYFAGWSDNVNATTPTLFAGDTYEVTDSSTTFYAVYMENTAGVTFEENLVSASTLSQNIRKKFGITNVNSNVVVYNAYLNGDNVNNGVVVVPSVYQNRPVVSIVKGSESLDSVHHLIIGDGIETISNNAFKNATNLKTIQLNNTLTTIGDNVFENCSSLQYVTINKNVTKIGNNAFMGCVNLTGVTFNAVSVEDLDANNNVFGKAGENTNFIFTIGADVKYIPANMFNYESDNMTNLTKVVVVGKLESIGQDAFKSNTIDTIDIKSIDNWCNVSFKNAESNPISVSKNLQSNGQIVTHLVISDDVTRVKAYAFNNAPVSLLTIGKSVTSIGDFAFSNLVSVSRVNYNAEMCSNLSSTNSVFKNLGKDITGTAFVIGNNVNTVPSYLLYNENNNINVNKVVISCGVRALGNNSLSYLNLSSLYIPSSVSISNSSGKASVIYGCPENMAIYTDAKSKPSKWQSNWNVYLVDSDETTHKIENVNYNTQQINYLIDNAQDLINVQVVDGIKYCTFDGTKYAIAIADNTITNLVLAQDTDVILTGAFKDNLNLVSITLPENLKTIMAESFSGCVNINKIYFNATHLNDLIANYMIGDDNNNNVFKLVGTNTDGVEVIFGDNVTYVPALLFNPDDTLASAPKIKSIKLSNSITSIGTLAFAYNNTLTSIYIPQSIETIVANTYLGSPFYNCNKDLKLYCAFANQPDGFGTYWYYYNNGKKLTVVNNVESYEDYLELIKEGV